MKKGKEVRKNGNVIIRKKRWSGYIGYDVEFLQPDGSFVSSGGNPWDYLRNARDDADGRYPRNRP